MKAHYLNPFAGKKLCNVQCVHQWLVHVEAFMETQRIYIGCGMVLLHPNVVEGPCAGLVNGARAGNVESVHHVDARTI